jgi:UDP-galactopyranose mutase
MYDLVIVGAGITAATLCAKLKDRYKIVVLDTRAHLGGNCYDYKTAGTYVHQYGPHIFHSPNMQVVEFLSQYTDWKEYTHAVTAEVQLDDKKQRCSFPYSRQAAAELGRELTPDEVINTFFKGYSQKMWGKPWEQLPASITGRVPKDTKDHPVYFPDQFVGLPDQGYTAMMAKMFEGVELVLGAPEHLWTTLQARRVVYCGRPDRIPVRNDPAKRVYGNLARERGAHWLEYVSLRFTWQLEDWSVPSAVLNFCDVANPHTRATHYASLTGGSSRLVGYERPSQIVPVSEIAPYYPVPSQENQELYREVAGLVQKDYPGLVLAGRLGANKYIDVHQAVGAALALASTLAVDLTA